MHYGNLVIIEKTDDIEKAVEKAMGPSEENGGFWDWYQIGGRWTGVLDGYSPEKDLANADPTRPGEVLWPTEWKKHAGDIAPISTVTDEAYKRFFRVVTPYKTYGGEYYKPWKSGTADVLQRLEMPPLDWLKSEYPDHLVVVVDNHS